jgi:hypothetical protein
MMVVVSAIAPVVRVQAETVKAVDSSEPDLLADMHLTTDYIPRVSQLRDVAPGDWAYEALANLMDRYACLEGYPDGTFRGDRPISRYEFAAGLSACLAQINRQQNSSAPTDQGETITRLMAEFKTELTSLGAQVDSLEGKTQFLEDHGFSTTTKLEGKVIMAAIAETGSPNDNQITFGDRVRLNLDTSFTGRDNLRVRLAASNAVTPDIGTPEGSLAFADSESGGNNLEVDALVYSFPLTEKLQVAIAANAGASDDFASTINALDGDGDEFALSRFGTRNPIYYQIEDKGLGLTYNLSEKLILSLGYMVPDANDPSPKAGLFNGAYGAMGQLHFIPSDNFEIGFTYLNGHNLSDTGTGSQYANLRSFTETQFGAAVPTSSNSYGIEASWKLGDRLTLGGWVGYSNISTLSTLGGQLNRGSLDVWNWAMTAALPDLFTEGATGGLIIGMEPKVTDSTLQLAGNFLKDADTSLHIEAFYQFPITENIMITPGIIWLTAPDHNANNDDVVIGTIRTLFSF